MPESARRPPRPTAAQTRRSPDEPAAANAECLNTTEAARLLGVTRRGVRYLVEHGALAALSTPHDRRFRLDDVEALRLHREAARSAERSLRRRTIGAAEAARRLGISRRGLLYNIHRGALPALRTPYGWRIQPEDLEAFRLDRKYRVAVYGDIRGGVAGAPRGNLNTVKNGAKIGRLNRILRDLAPRTRQAVQTAVAAEVLRRAAAAPDASTRHRARIAAAIDVIEAYRRAVAVPPRHELDRHVRVLRAMAPFLAGAHAVEHER